jgi:hypothetical protein
MVVLQCVHNTTIHCSKTPWFLFCLLDPHSSHTPSAAQSSHSCRVGVHVGGRDESQEGCTLGRSDNKATSYQSMHSKDTFKIQQSAAQPHSPHPSEVANTEIRWLTSCRSSHSFCSDATMRWQALGAMSSGSAPPQIECVTHSSTTPSAGVASEAGPPASHMPCVQASALATAGVASACCCALHSANNARN